MNRPALVAHLRGRVNKAERRVRELHACRDWLGLRRALIEYWVVSRTWRAAL